MTKKRIIVVGAGLTGAVIARELAELDYRVDIVEARDHLAGNAHDIFVNGVNIHQYGPHLFHTDNKEIAHYAGEKLFHGNYIGYRHKVRALVGEEYQKRFDLPKFVPLPIGPSTRFKLTDAQVLEIFYMPYTKKMWGMDISEISDDVLKRVKFSDVDTPFYFKDMYQFLPLFGYTESVTRFLDHPNIKIHLKTQLMPSEASKNPGLHIFNCAPIDQWCEYRFGDLPYRSIRFKTGNGNSYTDEYVKAGVATTNFTTQENVITRYTVWNELPTSSNKTDIMYTTEEPCDYRVNNDERYYPVKDRSGTNSARYAQYHAYVESEIPNMTFVGRCGRYQYIDMHQAIGQALAVVAKFRKKENEEASWNVDSFEAFDRSPT